MTPNYFLLANIGYKITIIHPASTTHQQLSESQLTSGVSKDLISFSGWKTIEPT
jgi:O-acetylhomoserine/O-acetylserine sulfhydrylase-like pyridoxal-dependent enzyme